MNLHMIKYLLIASITVSLTACGGSGGAPVETDTGTDQGAGTIEPEIVQREGIAILANNRFVDYQYTATGKPESDSEAATIEYILRLQGHTVTPFTNISVESLASELKTKKTFIIPELQRGARGNLNGPLEQAQHTLIADFVRTGGTLIGFLSATTPSDRIGYVLTSTFGYKLINVATNISSPINRADTNATGYENCGLSTLAVDKTPQTNAYRAIDRTSLPDQAKIIYADANGNAMVTVIPEGEGQVILLGWDYRRVKPMTASSEGYLDGGWWNVLYRAARYDEVLPSVAVIGFDDAANVAKVSDALMETCQIGSVKSITQNSGGLPQSVDALMSYDSVLFYRERGYDVADNVVLNNFTNSMADYVDNGGALVIANAGTFETPFRASLGRLEQVMFLKGASTPPYIRTVIEMAAIKNEYHPITVGLSYEFEKSDIQIHNSNSGFIYSTNARATGGTTAILKYSNGNDLVRIGEINASRRVDINTTPVPVVGQDPGTNGEIGRLVANSMVWASGYNKPSYQTFRYDQGSISAAPKQTADAVIKVSGAPRYLSEVKVRITVNHTSVSDLDISLKVPATNVCSGLGFIRLANDGTNGGPSYMNMEISDSGSVSAKNAIGKLEKTSSIIASGSLARCHNANANGDWALSVYNNNRSGSNQDAIIVDWSLIVR